MARNITARGCNELKIHDNISSSAIVLYHRTPTTQERQAYSNMSVQRKGRKIKFNTAAARLKFGLKILTGFREGDFVRIVDGKQVPFSADPTSSNYLKTWKEEVEAGAADLVMLLAAHVFDGSAEIDEEQDDAADDGPDEDDADPNFGTTSPR
ncbi:MAG: hypothetical protein M0P55_15165 [Clostridiales bacterium]|nr:hypothetical protein [Clostridiales bacterium]